jgi:hypothetical protein
VSSDYYGALAGEIADEGEIAATEIGQCAYCDQPDRVLCPYCGECGSCCRRDADCGGFA